MGVRAQCLCHVTDLSIELLHVDSEQQPWPGWSLADYLIWMSNPFHFFPVWQSSGWCSLWPGFFQGCVSIFERSFICCQKRDKWAWRKSDVSLDNVQVWPLQHISYMGGTLRLLGKGTKEVYKGLRSCITVYFWKHKKKAVPQLYFDCSCGCLGQNVWPMSLSPWLKWACFKSWESGMHWLAPNWD